MILDILFVLLKTTLYAFVLPLVAWFAYIRISKFHTTANRLPGPRLYLPIIGFFPRFKGEVSEILETVHITWPRLYGGIYRLFVGSECFVIITSPELIEPICKSQKYVEKGKSYDLLFPWLGRGLLTNFGDSWKARRRLLTPTFHFEILNNFMDVFNEQSRTFVRVLNELSNQVVGPIDLGPPAHRCTLDIICEAAMGVKVDAQTTDSEFFHSIERVGQIIHSRIRNSWLMIPFVFNYISPLGKELKSVIANLNNFSDRVIEERRQSRSMDGDDQGAKDESANKRLALLDLLLKVSDDEKALTNEELRSEINTFLLAGHDTTATLVCWFLYSMASYPEQQEKVRKELDDLFTDSDRYCTQEDLSDMKYMECCIKETLRLYPSAPTIARTATEDIKLGDYVIPEGSSMMIAIYGLHHNPNSFPDPEKFDPERFYPEASQQRHPFSYVPFSAGPRNCIGQRFALMEAKVILSTLLRKFEFEIPANCEPPKPFVQIVLKSLTGVKLIVKRLEGRAL